ncbi:MULTISPECIES: hypothetical protein [Streptosporangiaceae]|uniref:hypothetical protein n=1 Tax=Streptosporangiaceae TaxID=2004 RepID=UPI0033F901F5
MDATVLLIVKLAVTTAAVIAWYRFQAYKSRNRLLIFTFLLATVGVLILAGCKPGPDITLAASCPPAQMTPTVPPNPVLDGSYRAGASFPC